jgi:hypothetical protein
VFPTSIPLSDLEYRSFNLSATLDFVVFRFYGIYVSVMQIFCLFFFFFERSKNVMQKEYRLQERIEKTLHYYAESTGTLKKKKTNCREYMKQSSERETERNRKIKKQAVF